MDDTVVWQHVNNVSIDAPDEYKRHALQFTKDEVGRKLYSILEQCKNPAVVEIIEKIDRVPAWVQANDEQRLYSSGYPMIDEIRIIVKVTPVRYRHVEIPKLDTNFSPVASPTFFERLRYAVRGRW